MSTSTTAPTQTQTPPNEFIETDEVAAAKIEKNAFQPLTENGLQLQINFAWSKFTNNVSEVNGSSLKPLYIQHFGMRKPNLRYNAPDDKTELATGTINTFHISGECHIGGRTIELKPLRRLETQYNYLSYAFADIADPKTPVAVSWVARFTKKTWDFVCIDAAQMPIAQFSANLWKLVEVGNIYFAKSAATVTDAQRDEVVFTGLTIFYIMVTRMNNPLHLLGAAFSKPGVVKAGGEEVELEDRKRK